MALVPIKTSMGTGYCDCICGCYELGALRDDELNRSFCRRCAEEHIERILAGEPGPPRDVVLLNTSLALVAGGLADDFREGIEQAAKAIDSGAARDRLRALVEFTRRG